MKRLFGVVMLAASVWACRTQNSLGPSTVQGSAGGVLPQWMFAYNGHLVRPRAGVYGVYAAPEIMTKPELRQHLVEMLTVATNFTGSQVRFVLTSDSSASIRYRLDASDPHVVPGTAVGYGEYRALTNYWSHDISIVIRDESWFKTNVPLHELGHFIFGPGHSDTPEDIMNVVVRDYRRMSFSSNEKTVWDRSLAFAPGTTF